MRALSLIAFLATCLPSDAVLAETIVLAQAGEHQARPMRNRAIAGVQHNTFFSKAYGAERDFSIFLPESYANGTQTYPVLYWLHGKGGDPQRSSRLAMYLQKAIADGIMPETIMVFPDGDQDRFYTDDVDGSSPVETMIIQELIPYIDSHYRTQATSKGRMLEGFSMGGFGALKFAAKYPERFSSVVAYGAPKLDGDLGQGKRDEETFIKVFDGNSELSRSSSPTALFRQNKDRVLASGLEIRLVSGGADGTRASVQRLHEVLTEIQIPHEYTELPGVRHTPGMYYDNDQGSGYRLHAKALSGR